MSLSVQSRPSNMRMSTSSSAIQYINPNEPLVISNDAELENAFHFWQGVSGKRYIHSVYSIFTCPELPKANYVLVKRNEEGNCQAVAIGQTSKTIGSLNLAFLRQQAAKLGANEIHINVMSRSDDERNMVRLDLLGCQAINGQQPAS